MKRDPEKDRAWRERSARKYADKQRELGRKPLAKVGKAKARTIPAERDFRAALVARAGGMCEVRTPACPAQRHAGHDPHHLWTSDRDRGIHDPARGLWVCRLGHDWIGAHPDLAREQGWYKRDGDR